MTPLLRTLLTLAVGAFLVLSQTPPAIAGPVLNLGVAGGYSGFFLGDVKAGNDVEGKLAVGGNYQGPGSIGYRNPYGSTGPSLVVGGDAKFTSNGGIFNGPTTNIDTNQGYGPASYTYASGYGVYGGKLSGKTTGMDLRKESDVIDFQAEGNYLKNLSRSLSAYSATGSVEQLWGPWSDTTLRGSGVSGALEVFNIQLGGQTLRTLDLEGVASDAFVLINILNAGNISVEGAYLGLFDDLEGRVLFNFANASSVAINTFLDGGVLAPFSDIRGTGHVEGVTVGYSLSTAVELGYEPWKGNYEKPVSSVPEPHAIGLVLIGLLAMAGGAKLKRQ